MSDIEDVMIDFETLATTSDAVILSAAFVEFERYPAKGEWADVEAKNCFLILVGSRHLVAGFAQIRSSGGKSRIRLRVCLRERLGRKIL